ncbi:MAG: type VI secretion system Vgr family protein [Polyangiaceae bacterium]
MPDPHHLQLTLSAGEGVYDVVGLRGVESVSELYRFELDVTCDWAETLPSEVGAGADVTLRFRRGETELRRIHGVIESRTARLDSQLDNPVYRLVLVPHLTRARLVRAQQIFLGMSVVEIIQQKLALIGLDETVVSVSQLGDYPRRDFVVQYDETDLDFISRLAEHLGISFYFEQLESTEQLVFADSLDGFHVNAQHDAIQLSRVDNQFDCVHGLEVVEAMLPGQCIVYDHNYRRPDLRLVGQRAVPEGHGGGTLEYGCHVKDEAEAAALAAVRAETFQCRARQYRGWSSICNMVAGGITTVEATTGVDETQLLVTRVDHEVTMREDRTLAYRNTFHALPTTVTFRPERRTPRPRIAGFVTGTVQGPPGSSDAVSPFLDDEGRYTVQFHFDAVLGDPTQRGSHLVRMSQPFGGTGHGMHFPLRPGTEVMIAFANGDPDRPVIVGAIPNAHTRTPVTARNATQNRITAASGAIFEISERR